MEDQTEDQIATLTRSAGLKVEYSRRIDSQPWGPRRWHFHDGDIRSGYRITPPQGLSDEEALSFVEKAAAKKQPSA